MKQRHGTGKQNANRAPPRIAATTRLKPVSRANSTPERQRPSPFHFPIQSKTGERNQADRDCLRRLALCTWGSEGAAAVSLSSDECFGWPVIRRADEIVTVVE